MNKAAAFKTVFIALSLSAMLSVATAEDEEEIVAFTEVGEHTWNVPDNVDSVDVLVVGGGGGGAGYTSYSSAGGGGGGAGGLVYREGYAVDPGEDLSIEVGEGGSGIDDNPVPAEDGKDSKFDDLTAIGGGGGILGGGDDDVPASDGGSGGGARQEPPGQELQTGSETGGYGNDGSRNSNDAGGGGGGGAGEEPSDISSGDGSDGGDGLYFGDEFGEEYGENGYFAGGGAGGGEDGAIGGTGGLGGGGDGSSPGASTTPNAGISNTGGGGGGGSSSHSGADGGSGIVLVKFDSDFPICDRRGLFNECISNSTHDISGQSFDINSVFEAEQTSVFEALNEKASIAVSNSSLISGTWRGGIDIETEKPRIEAGAEFRPEGERIVIGK